MLARAVDDVRAHTTTLFCVQDSGVASFSIDMAAALHKAGISLSVFSAYPPGLLQGKPSWPSLLYKLFEQAEQVGHSTPSF